jgi:hypothetical protein
LEVLSFPSRWSTALVLFIFVVEEAEGWTERWDLVLHGETWLQLLSEFINGDESAPLLCMVIESGPFFGVASAATSSPSMPVCQFGGPPVTLLRRSSPSGQVLGVGIVRCAVKRIILNGEVGPKKNLVLLFGHVCNS